MESKFIHKDRRQSQEVFTDRRNLRQVLLQLPAHLQLI